MREWIGLYYPHVHFRDERWLKLTALYWDRLYRFDADDHEDSFPVIFGAEVGLVAHGFVRPAVPRRRHVEAAARRLLKALDGVDLSRYAYPRFERHEFPGLETGLAEWKTSPQLVERLSKMDLATRSPAAPGRIQLHMSLASAYLLLLGSLAAPAYGAAPLTDDAFDLTVSGLGARRLVAGVLNRPAPEAAAGERAALLVNLSVAAVLPRDIEEISVDRIVDFRHRYAGERARFRDAVDAMVAESTTLGDIRDQAILLDHLRSRFETRIQPALDDLQRAMRGRGMETLWGAINVQAAAPPVATGALAVLATQPSPRRPRRSAWAGSRSACGRRRCNGGGCGTNCCASPR
ncbi:DUF6236 family protein [Nonomuraea antimicrobica]